MKWLTPVCAAAVMLLAAPAFAGDIVGSDAVLTIPMAGDFTWLSDAPVEKIQGTAKGATGTIKTNGKDFSKATGTISVPVGTMETGNGLRDKHLKGPDWLDAKSHPNITFTIEGVDNVKTEVKGDVTVVTGKARGKISIHGKSKAMSVPITAKIKGDKIKVDMKFEVTLADYDIKGSRGTIGKKVGETISIEGTVRGAAK